MAPLYKQAKSIAWDYLKHYSRSIPGTKINESELKVDFPWGSRIQLFGCDNPDNLRGQYFDGVVLDEYAQMPSYLFGEVIRPALSDRTGWAIFIGTPKGQNAFYELYEMVKDDSDWFVAIYKASTTGLIAEEELAAAKKIMTEDEYAQEYECSWTAAIQGSYYRREFEEADKEHRITKVPYEKSLPVNTAWDLGVGDSTAIWFYQLVGKEIHVIDYYETSGEGLQYYAKYLDSLKYKYGEHFAPHDIEVRELGSGMSRLETARKLGIKFRIVPRMSIDDGIQAVRTTFNKLWIDETKCKQGIDALRNYRREYDEKRGEFKDKPYHDWSSHAADAFRYLCITAKEKKKSEKLVYPKLPIV